MSAAIYGHLEIVRNFVEHSKVSVDIYNKYSNTGLI